MYIGGIIGAVIGYFALPFLGIFGAIIGFALGHLFDRGQPWRASRISPEQRAHVQQAFFDALFPLMGRLAKADGHISAEEIAGTEHLMEKMGLNAQQRQVAIELFKQGVDASYDVDPVLANLRQHCASHSELKQIYLVYLISLAYADGVLHPREEQLLEYVADQLGYSRLAFNHLLGMIKAQTYFYRGQQQNAGYRSGYGAARERQSDELALAYEALGVTPGVSDKELKSAYRKLMSEFHPDKLAGQGVPEDMVKLATERSQEIHAAYDLIKKQRKR